MQQMRLNIVGFCFCSVKSNMHDIPACDSFTCPIRKGHLQKLTNRGWFYSGSWKSRYCVLDGSKLYFYEKEQSKGSEKNTGVLNLDYYDLCEENKSKDKKNPHVFVIGTSVKGLFEQNRHQFAAETSEELQSWVLSIQKAIAEARTRRTKSGRKKQDGKSPDLSHSSQETEGASTTCLVNATKDRAKGPLGRRLPQRKSMMPQSRVNELADIRQRSISLSSPEKSQNSEEQSPSQHSQPSSENKWLSMSMEDMERESDDAFETQRSSSVFDIQAKLSPTLKETEVSSRPGLKTGPGPRRGNLLGQHAALTKELEMKLKAGITPGVRRQPSESEDGGLSKQDAEDKKIDVLCFKVDSTKEALDALEEKVNHLIKKVEPANESPEKTKTPTSDIIRQVTESLQEAEKMNTECKKALSDVKEAKLEYEILAKECKEMLARMNNNQDCHNNDT